MELCAKRSVRQFGLSYQVFITQAVREERAQHWWTNRSVSQVKMEAHRLLVTKCSLNFMLEFNWAYMVLWETDPKGFRATQCIWNRYHLPHPHFTFSFWTLYLNSVHIAGTYHFITYTLKAGLLAQEGGSLFGASSHASKRLQVWSPWGHMSRLQVSLSSSPHLSKKRNGNISLGRDLKRKKPTY